MTSVLSPRVLKAGGALAVAIVVVIIAFAVHSVRSFREASNRVLHTQELRLELGEMVSRLKDIQLVTRNYLTGGDERALESRAPAKSEFDKSIADLRRLMADDPSQQRSLDRLDDLVRELMVEHDVYIGLRRTGGLAAVAARAADGKAKQMADDIRTVFIELQAEEGRILQARLARARRDAAITNLVLVVGLGLDAVLVGAIIFILRSDLKARDSAALALRQQADEIKDLYNQAPCGYHSLDDEGRITAINDTQLAWLGYRRGHPSNPTLFADLLAPQSRVIFEAAFRGMTFKGDIRDLELELMRRDGSSLYCLLNATAIRNATGRLVATRSTLFDLTQRKNVEAVVEQSRAYFESIVDTVHESLVILTPDLTVKSANRVFYETFGLQPANSIGRPFGELNDGVWDIAGLNTALATVIPTHSELTDYEVHADFPRLGPKIMRLNARTLDHVGNNTRMALLAIEDITDRKRIEASLEHERYLLVQLMANVTEFIYFKDRSSRFLRVNHGLAARFGVKEPADVIGKTDFDFFAPSHAERAYADEQEVMRTGRPLTKEEEERWPDGRVSWVLTVKLPLHDTNCAVVGTFGMSRDISQRKRAEAQLQELNGSLQQKAKELEAANQELEAFSYSVSHDLRAPLRHIGFFASMLKKQLPPATLDEKCLRYLTTISNSARGMGQLIDDLLQFAQVGRAPLNRTRIHLGTLVSEVRNNLQQEVNGRVVEWKLGPLPEVQGDAALLRQVFANLIGNAVKYTRQRGEALIEIGTLEGNGTETVIFISDNGAGFDMKYSDKLFGVFQRLHSSQEFEGTGVGLANVRRIVQRHGGRTWAEGAVDGGATFYFSLPAAPVATKPSP